MVTYGTQATGCYTEVTFLRDKLHINNKQQSYIWRAENQSGPTQNQVLEIAWIVQKCNKNVYTIWTCGQKCQIPKCSAASEIHFKSIPMLGETNSTFVG